MQGKYRFILILPLILLAALALLCPAPKAAREIASAEELFKTVMDRYKQIDSYSYLNCEEGYDTFAKERTKEAEEMIKRTLKKN